jgi:hypothetical protein
VLEQWMKEAKGRWEQQKIRDFPYFPSQVSSKFNWPRFFILRSRFKMGESPLTDFMGVETSKKRKRRTSFTPHALEILNSSFERNTHPSGEIEISMMKLATETNEETLNLHRNRHHVAGTGAGIRTRGYPDLVLQQTTSSQEHCANDE